MTEREQYELTIRAALSMKKSKFDLAAALATDIPFKEEGDGQSITVALEEVAAQIVDAGGDEIAIATLRGYRDTAFWVKSPSGGEFQWRSGSGFDAHKRAAQGGMDYAEFARMPRTSREIQSMLGQKVSSTSVKHTVDNMTTTEKVDMARALATEDPQMVSDIAIEQHKEDVVKRLPKAPSPSQHKDPSRSDQLTSVYQSMVFEMAGAASHAKLVTQRWERQLDQLGAFVDSQKHSKISDLIHDVEEVYADFRGNLYV